LTIWRKQFETLKEENRELSAENKRLRAENEGLKEQLKRSSKNSSQPLSADKFKGFKALPKSGRKLGAQPGHAGKSQKRYPPESCERIENYYPQACDRKSCWMKRSIRRWSQSKEDKRLAVGSRHVFGNRLRDISLSLEGGCPADVDSRLWRYCRQ